MMFDCTKVKVGDPVIMINSHDEICKVALVQHITPKGYIKVDNIYFRPDSGSVKLRKEYPYIHIRPISENEGIKIIKSMIKDYFYTVYFKKSEVI